MRKKYNKVLIIVLLACFTFSPFSPAVVQAETQPGTMVRIGLYYGSTGVASFKVSAVKGLELGYSRDGQFNVLVEGTAGGKMTVRKDAYYVYSDNLLKEYSPSTAVIPTGTKTGPFHVKVGGDLSDIGAVQQKIEEIGKMGIVAYPAYSDTWQIWTGFYTSQEEAEKDIADNIRKKLGDEACVLVQPSAAAILVLNEADEVALAFASGTSYLQIHPKKGDDPCLFNINNANYRGDLEVRRFSDSDMTVINILDMEEYLYSVIPAELEAVSHPEALKAQAIVARTFAMNSMNTYKKWDFNMDPTTRCQVYKGFDNEHPATTKAVNDTRNMLIKYNGTRALAYFFASSGGQTEAVKNVWQQDIPYLQSVEDKYESGKSWHYNWEVSLTAARIKDIVRGSGTDIGDVLGMKITKVSEAGRAIELAVRGTINSATFYKIRCRDVFSLDSQWYTITTDSDIFLKGKETDAVKDQLSDKKVMTSKGLMTVKGVNGKVTVMGAGGIKKQVPLVPEVYIFKGKGWGHAVGLSQEGAKGMANAGYTCEQIIKHYFTGTTVE